MRPRTGLRWLSASAGACLLAVSVLGPSASAATVPGPIGCQTLARGASGKAVAVLQGDLAQTGYYRGVVNGTFGVSTASALVAFQRERGLDPTGVLGRITLDALARSMGIGRLTVRCSAAAQNAVTHTGMLATTSDGGTRTFVQGSAHPAIAGGLHVGGRIDGRAIVRVLHLTATAYGATAQDNYPYGATDAFGLPLKPGDVAVDPSVIPLNTKMYVTGYHTPYLPAGGELAVARDTGGAIQGHRIDMYINSTNEALINSFGIQSVTAYVLS